MTITDIILTICISGILLTAIYSGVSHRNPKLPHIPFVTGRLWTWAKYHNWFVVLLGTVFGHIWIRLGVGIDALPVAFIAVGVSAILDIIHAFVKGLPALLRNPSIWFIIGLVNGALLWAQSV